MDRYLRKTLNKMSSQLICLNKNNKSKRRKILSQQHFLKVKAIIYLKPKTLRVMQLTLITIHYQVILLQTEAIC